jgi:hypothetical protein
MVNLRPPRHTNPKKARAKKRKPPMHLTLSGDDIDVEKFVLDAFGKYVPDVNVADSITDGEILLTIDGAPQVTVTVHDPDRYMIKSGALWDSKGHLRALDVELDGIYWRLMAFRKTGDDMSLTLELREVAWLRAKIGPRKAASRAKLTRAQYILQLVRSVKQYKIPYVIPELRIKQRIAPPDDPATKRSSSSDAADGGTSSTSTPSTSAPNIYAVGDSLGVGADQAGLGKLLGRRYQGNNQVNRTTAQGYALARAKRRMPATLLVQLGTNDSSPSDFEIYVRRFCNLPGVKDIYWVNRHGSIGSNADFNAALRAAAQDHDKLHIIDWDAAVNAGEVTLTDGNHPNPAGYKYRAQMIAHAIRGNKGVTASMAAATTKEPKKSSSNKDPDREPGFPANFKMKGVSKKMLDNMTVSLTIAEQMGVTDRVKLVMLVAGFGESGWLSEKTDWKTHTHKGVFQSNQIPQFDLEQQTTYFLKGGRSFVAGGAIGAVKNLPTWTIGAIAAHVEISDGSATYYDGFRDQAEKVLEAWGGAVEGIVGSGADSASSVTAYKRYEYKVDKKETYWDAIQRMAEEVRWRAFFSFKDNRPTFYYIREDRLMKAKALYWVSEDTPGVINIDFEQNYRKAAQKATITCRIDRWQAPPGTIIVLEDANPTGSRRWLVESIRRNLFSKEAEITLKRAMQPRAEPAPDSYQKDTTNTGDPADDGVTGGGKDGAVKGNTDPRVLQPAMLDFLRKIAGNTSEEILIFDNSRHSKFVKGTNRISNHFSGYAADIQVGGDSRNSAAVRRKGDNICIAVLNLCGLSRSQARAAIGGPRTTFAQASQWGNWSVEIGWQTVDHYDHVHVGFNNRPPVGKNDPGWTGANP